MPQHCDVVPSVCSTTREAPFWYFLIYFCIMCVLLDITAQLDLETQALYCTCDNICKFVYTTNKLWFDSRTHIHKTTNNWWRPPLSLTGHVTKQPLHHSPKPEPQQVQITCPWWDDHQTHTGGKVHWTLLYTEWCTETRWRYVVWSFNYCSAFTSYSFYYAVLLDQLSCWVCNRSCWLIHSSCKCLTNQCIV